MGTRSNRLLKEMERMNERPPWGISCCLAKANCLDNMTATIMGPKESPYENGLFKLSIEVPDNYPFEPPHLKFITPIYHPNIDSGGRICMDLLKMPPRGSWRPTITLESLLVSVQSLMSHPNPDDPLMIEIANQFKNDKNAFIIDARKHTTIYAS